MPRLDLPAFLLFVLFGLAIGFGCVAAIAAIVVEARRRGESTSTVSKLGIAFLSLCALPGFALVAVAWALRYHF